MAQSWTFQTNSGPLSEAFDKEERYMLSAHAASKADFGHLGSASSLRPLSSSAQALMSSGSLPTLKPRVRNTIIGCAPDEVVETRDWMSHSNRTHRELPMGYKSGGAGGPSKFGVKDPATGKIQWLSAGQRYGVAEAFGVTSYARPTTTANLTSSQQLRKSPSMAELDELLVRRSRARGRGGRCAKVCDVVQTRWNVLYASGSASSCTMPTRNV